MNKVGVFIGKFYPFHIGHEYVIKESLKYLNQLIIVPCWDEGQTIPLEIRVNHIRKFCSANAFSDKVTIYECLESTELGTEHKGESREDLSLIWSKYLIETFPQLTHFVGSEEYINMMAKYGNREALVFKRQYDISSRHLRNNFDLISKTKDYIPKVAIVGIESSGKSTLVRKLADELSEVEVVDEYGRIYCEANTSIKEHINHEFLLQPEDFINIAKGHNRMLISAYRKALAKGKNLIISDTEHVVTMRFLNYYKGGDEEKRYLCDMVQNQHYDLVIYLEPLELELDGTRLEYDEQERYEQNEALKTLMKKYHKNIVYIDNNNLNDRVQEAIIAFEPYINKE